LKNTPAGGRAAAKNRLAQRLHSEEGLTPALCAGALDLLEAALWGMPEQKILCRTCGKELQPEWSACPYCGAPAADAQTSVSASEPSGSPGAGYGPGLIEPPPSALPAAAKNAPETIPILESEKKRDEPLRAWSGAITFVILFSLIILSGWIGIDLSIITDNTILSILSILIIIPCFFIIWTIVDTIISKIIGKKPK
jgi:hypothetical protein